MTKLALTLMASAVALAALTSAIATQHGGNMTDHLAAFAKHLGLTSSQEKTLKQQHLEAKKKLDAIDADKKLDQKSKDIAKQQLHDELMAKTKKVLTAEQFKKLQTMHQTQKVELHLHDLLQKLNLTEAQASKIKELVHSTTSQMHEIQADSSLSDDQKEAKARQLHAASFKRIQALLTPAQQKELEKLAHGG